MACWAKSGCNSLCCSCSLLSNNFLTLRGPWVYTKHRKWSLNIFPFASFSTCFQVEGARLCKSRHQLISLGSVCSHLPASIAWASCRCFSWDWEFVSSFWISFVCFLLVCLCPQWAFSTPAAADLSHLPSLISFPVLTPRPGKRTYGNQLWPLGGKPCE